MRTATSAPIMNAPPKKPPTIAPTGADSEDTVELPAAGGVVVENGKEAEMLPLGDIAVIRRHVEVKAIDPLGTTIDVVKTVPIGFDPSLAVTTTDWINEELPQYQAVPKAAPVLRTYLLQYGSVDALEWWSTAGNVWEIARPTF